MSEERSHRLNVEGADPLLLAGVNDANLNELERVTGARISLRGDILSLNGTAEQVELATAVSQALLDLARMGEEISAEDVRRFAQDGIPETAAPVAKGRSCFPASAGRSSRRPPGSATTSRRSRHTTSWSASARPGPERPIWPWRRRWRRWRASGSAGSSWLGRRSRLANRSGFLPGDLQAKVDPYLRPLYDALEDMMPPERVQKALEQRTIEIAPLAYMRGRTLSDAFIILDEAQNATGLQMKMFLTRIGVNSKVVVTGDKTQIDLPKREESGLIQIERILPGIEGIAFCYLGEADVVRHRLVRAIIRAYAEDQNG